ncbi:MAG: inositol-3-phosphate synthase, partial [Sphingomonadales bacterium]
MSKKIKVAIIGVGNCVSSLVQGLSYYKEERTGDAAGLMHWDLGGYLPSDIGVVAAFDIDRRKVGKDVADAIFEAPNCTEVFNSDVPKTGVKVLMGKILDGYSQHMAESPDHRTFLKSNAKEPEFEDVVKVLNDSGAEILLNYLPVGSQKATEFYAECALEVGLGFINNIPVFIASTPEWAARFKAKNLPIIGDDIKAQVGAT